MTSNRKSMRRATAATEFAVVLPVLVFLGIAGVDLGRFVHLKLGVSNAARTGAEYGATHRLTAMNETQWRAAVESAVVEELGGIVNASPSDLQIDIDTTIDAAGLTCVEVEVAYPFETIVAWPTIENRITLRHRAEFREFR